MSNEENPRGSMLDVLMQMAGERAAQRAQEREQKDKAREAGVSEQNWFMINLFKQAFSDMAGSLAFHMTAACQTGDKKAAQMGVLGAEYLTAKARYMHDTLAQAGITPAEFGLSENLDLFCQRMTHAKNICQRVLDGEDLSHRSASSLINEMA